MADYNLGRARGTIDIDYDGAGARRAQADMATTAAEAQMLDQKMEQVNRRFDENRRGQIASAEAIVKARGEVENLRRSYQKYQEDYARAERRLQEAKEDAAEAVAKERDNFEKLRQTRIALERAEEQAERSKARAIESYERYQTRLTAVRIEVEKFNEAHIKATTGFRNLARDGERLGVILEGLEERLSSVARILGQVGLLGMFGGAAGGQLFATAAGGLNILMTGLAGIVEVANSVIGAIALIPGVVNAAVISIGSLALAFRGVGAALGSIGDPAKFVEAIEDLSPAAQQAMLTIQSFAESLRGARNEIQESFFAPIVAEIQPLIYTWLPQLMNAGKEMASQFGQAFAQVSQYFQTDAAQSSFQRFMQNTSAGFQEMRSAIEPFLDAWNTLAEVGSQTFPRIGIAITDVNERFRAWINSTAQSGQLSDFLNEALDGFTNMGRIIRDLGFGFVNMLEVFTGAHGNSALQRMADMSARFREWGETLSGQNAMFSFFSLLRTAASAVRPTLSALGDSFAIIGRTMTELGIALQPGLLSFFESFRSALEGLAPHVLGMGPAINQFLVAFGNTLEEVVASIGPQLPELFASLSEAFITLLGLVPPLANVLAEFLSYVTPEHIVIFMGLLGALKAIGVAIPVVRGAMVALNAVMAMSPIGLLTVAVGALSAAAFLLITNWDQVKDTLSGAWSSITNALGDVWNAISNWFDGQDWASLGMKIITGVVGGMKSLAEWLGREVGQILMPARENFPSSPAKRGPFSQASPEQLGSMLVTAYAGGMVSATPAVDAAAATVAGSASGIGAQGLAAGVANTSFTSAGVSGVSGGDYTQGRSGFDQWVQFIVQELSAWHNIFQQAFQMVDNVGRVVADTIRTVANIWDGGDNPLTRPGGLFGPPLPVAQQQVPGVPSKPIPGVAPDKWGRDLASMTGQGALQQQQNVPGVPRKAKDGDVEVVPTAPPSTVTEGGATVPLVQRSDGTWTSSDQAWADLIERESGGRNIPQGIDDVNSRRGDPATGIFQITGDTWRRHGGDQFAPRAMDATPEQQAQIAARILERNPSGSDWGAGRPGRESAEALMGGLVRPQPQAQAGAPRVQGAVPTADLPPTVDATSRRLPSQDRGGVSPDLFLLHTQEGTGTPESLMDYQERQGKYSYNYYIDQNTGQVHTGVDPSRAAISTGGVNQRSINAVIAGSTVEWTREEWLERMPALQSLARLAAESGVPLQMLDESGNPNDGGIGGHDWATRAGFPTSGHSDPGPNFPWDVFSGLVESYSQGIDPGAPELGRAFDPSVPPGTGSDRQLPDPTIPLAGLGGLAGGALIASALRKRSARRKMELGELLDDEELRWAMEPETPEETRAVRQASPEVQSRIPPELGEPASGRPQGAPAGADRPAPQLGVDSRGNTRVDLGGGRIVEVSPSGAIREVTPAPQPAEAPRAYSAPSPMDRTTVETPKPAPTHPSAPRAEGRPSTSESSRRPQGTTSVELTPPDARPGGIRGAMGTVGRGLGAGLAVLGPLMAIPTALELHDTLERDRENREREARGELPVFQDNDFGRTVFGPGGGIDTSAVERDLESSGAVNTPEQQAIVDAFNEGKAPGERALYFNQLPSDWQSRLGQGEASAGDVGWSLNADSLANIPLRGSTANAVSAAGLAPLYRPGTDEIPQEIKDLAADFGLNVSTYTSGGSLHQSGFAFDFTGAPEDMNRFADFIYTNLRGQTLELIHAEGRGGPDDRRWGIAGTKVVDQPGTMAYFDKDGINQYASHDSVGPNAHVHWATDVLPTRGGQKPTPTDSQQRRPRPGGPSATFQGTDADDWRTLPDGWDIREPIPTDIVVQNLPGFTREQIDEMPPMYYTPQPGTTRQVAVGEDYRGPYPVTPGRTIIVPDGTPGQPTPGFSETNDQRSPMQQFTDGMQSFSSIAGSAFEVFQEVIDSIGATANITRRLSRGFEDSESVVHFIQQFQEYLELASSVAGLVGDVGGMIAAIGGGTVSADGGATGAVGGGIQAIAGIVEAAIDTANAAITLGIDVYHQVGKYAGYYFGMNLGGEGTGPLGGNVRMLLNTRTNELMTYGEDNPMNKNTFQIPLWQQSYRRPEPTPQLPPQVNIYTGPGQTPRDMMNESMWLISTGAASVASVAGMD